MIHSVKYMTWRSNLRARKHNRAAAKVRKRLFLQSIEQLHDTKCIPHEFTWSYHNAFTGFESLLEKLIRKGYSVYDINNEEVLVRIEPLAEDSDWFRYDIEPWRPKTDTFGRY